MKLFQLQVCVKPLISYDSKLGLYKTINDAYMLLKTDRFAGGKSHWGSD